ncbi:hypothetical protein [Halomicrococcus sp. SG-WS-1]|uniref:hypothetical protein n=1 Tax=Halomicrococcus sp. SG-WS-1 TaxID=3439057 RepID=UPI003F79BBAF
MTAETRDIVAGGEGTAEPFEAATVGSADDVAARMTPGETLDRDRPVEEDVSTFSRTDDAGATRDD